MIRKTAESASVSALCGKLWNQKLWNQPTADLHREAENMLALQSRQSTSLSSLSLVSKAAQAVLREF